MKSGGGNLALRKALHLILHQRNERRHDERESRQQRGRQLIAERFPLAGRHDRQRIPTGQHRPDHVLLTRSKRGKPELFCQLSSEVVHEE